MPDTSTFSKREALRFGWRMVRERNGFFVGIAAFVLAVVYLPSFVDWVVGGMIPSLIIIGAGWIASSIVSLGAIRIALDTADGRTPRFADLFSQAGNFFRYLGATILYTLIILGGFILLIIPGIIWAIKFQFFPYFIVDRKLSPAEALAASGRLTQGAKGNLFLFFILGGLVNLAGALALLVGLLVTVPTVMVAYAYVFRRLEGRTGAPPPAPALPNQPAPAPQP